MDTDDNRTTLAEKARRIRTDLAGIDKKLARMTRSREARAEALRKIETQLTGELPKASRRTDHER